jgi:thiaminase
MADASILVRQARAEAAPVEQQLLAHPYIRAIEEGRLPRDELRRFVGEQWHIISSDLRSVAQLVSRFGATPAGPFFLDVLGGERAALAALAPLAAAVGATFTDLPGYEPLAGAHAYTCYMAWLGTYGSAGEVAAAYVVNFPAWGECCGRLSAGLRARYDFALADVGFFDLFAAPPAGFEEAALAVIQEDLDRGGDSRLMLRAARLLQAYELLYWDTLWEVAASGEGTANGASNPSR